MMMDGFNPYGMMALMQNRGGFGQPGSMQEMGMMQDPMQFIESPFGLQQGPLPGYGVLSFWDPAKPGGLMAGYDFLKDLF